MAQTKSPTAGEGSDGAVHSETVRLVLVSAANQEAAGAEGNDRE